MKVFNEKQVKPQIGIQLEDHNKVSWIALANKLEDLNEIADFIQIYILKIDSRINRKPE